MMRERRDDIAVKRFATQVEEAVLQADFFGIFRLAEYGQRKLGGFRQHFDIGNDHFDFTGRQVRIDHIGVTGHDIAVDADDAFRAQAFDLGKARRRRIEDQLGQAVMVTKVDKQKAAVIALAMDPARQADLGAGIRCAQGAAGVGTIDVHRVT